MLTKIYEPFDIIIVPFPFVDSHKSKRRPVLVLSQLNFQKETSHVCCLMITSVKHDRWYGDHVIADLENTGLNASSIIRQKLFTLDCRLIIDKIGHLSKNDIDQVKLHLNKNLIKY